MAPCYSSDLTHQLHFLMYLSNMHKHQFYKLLLIQYKYNLVSTTSNNNNKDIYNAQIRRGSKCVVSGQYWRETSSISVWRCPARCPVIANRQEDCSTQQDLWRRNSGHRNSFWCVSATVGKVISGMQLEFQYGTPKLYFEEHMNIALCPKILEPPIFFCNHWC